MGFGVLRSLIRPLSISSSTALTSRISATASCTTPFRALLASPKPDPRPQWLLPLWNHFHSLTDTRFPKRRPSASLRPSGACTHLAFFSWFRFRIRSSKFETSFFFCCCVVQGLMLGFSIRLANPFFRISPTKGVSRGGTRRNA